MLYETSIKSFVEESNRIEGILRPPTEKEVLATKTFLSYKDLHVIDVCKLNNIYEPTAKLRTIEGLDVIVGDYRPPRGGEDIKKWFAFILFKVNNRTYSPYVAHCEYERLHPFTDGNGRTGRAIWLWQTYKKDGRIPTLGFLHTWYYQSLKRSV